MDRSTDPDETDEEKISSLPAESLSSPSGMSMRPDLTRNDVEEHQGGKSSTSLRPAETLSSVEATESQLAQEESQSSTSEKTNLRKGKWTVCDVRAEIS